MSLKQRFTQEVIDLKQEPSVLVTAVKLPSGAIEVITNHQELEEKLKYIGKEYDHEFKLRRNNDVQIVGYLIA